MSASNDVPAQGAVAQPVTYPQFVAGIVPGSDVHQARPPVRRRATWVLSLVAGLGGWVVILLSIVLTIIYCIETANADEMVRKYGIGTGLIWIFPVSPFRHQCPWGNLRSHRVVAVQQLSGSEKSVLRPPAQRVAVDHPRGAVLGVHV